MEKGSWPWEAWDMSTIRTYDVRFTNNQAKRLGVILSTCIVLALGRQRQEDS